MEAFSAAATPRGVTASPQDRFEIPRPGHAVTPLERVRARLERATGGVAILCAPAGYGKTTQVALWAAAIDRPVAWADLNVGDNDPWVLASRLASMLHATTSVDADRAELRAPGPHPSMVVPVVTELLRRVDRPFVLVLDDVHLIDDPMTLDVLGAVLNNVQAESTIVLIGRSEPAVSLVRLQAGDRVDEIEAADLALSARDTRAIFSSMGLDRDDAQVDRCVEETEGWPVGLRFAALALREDPDTPIGGLARERLLAECVHDEWLRGLADDDLDFLLRVSGLEWMSGQLCDDILGRSDSGARLERLHRSRLLVAPLDRRGDAYRMHSLLRDVLDASFERLDRTARRAIDRAASGWFERHRDIDRAVRHAMRAGDDVLVEQLIIRHAVSAHTRGRYVTVRRWLELLPAEQVLANPAMCLIAALAAIGLGEDDEAQTWVRLGLAASPSPTGRNTPSTTPLELLTLKCLLSVGPIGECLADAIRAYEDLPPGIWHAAACEGVGVFNLALGLDDLAASRFREGSAEAHVTGAVTVRAVCDANLAVILGEQHDWAAATSLARKARQLVRDHELDNLPSLIVVTAMSALVEAMAGDPVTARAELILTRHNMAHVGGIGATANVQARISLADASLLLGDRAGARVLVDEAEAYLRSQPDAAGSLARVRALADRLAAARGALPLGPSSLTTAELRVLHLLPTNLSIADIAQRLFVSRNTAKSHAASIYRKLGVSSRSDAVNVARGAGLLPP